MMTLWEKPIFIRLEDMVFQRKGAGGPDGFKFDGILGAGQYVLRISSSGSEDGGFMSSTKDNLVTNFDLKANFSPFIIGEDEGGNPLTSRW